MYRELYSYVSPRSRAQGTLELLNVGCRDGLPWLRGDGKGPSRTQARVEVTEAIREWDYGEYEGLTSREIRDLRAKHGQGAWDIWREGCPGGEYVLIFFLFNFCCGSDSVSTYCSSQWELGRWKVPHTNQPKTGHPKMSLTG